MLKHTIPELGVDVMELGVIQYHTKKCQLIPELGVDVMDEQTPMLFEIVAITKTAWVTH